MSKIEIKNLTVTNNRKTILDRVTLNIEQGEILAIIGPAGSGKTTFLKCLNRLIDLEPDLKRKGEITLDGVSIYDNYIEVFELRRRVGMVFALPVPLPKSIYENLAVGLRLAGIKNQEKLNQRIGKSLKAVSLWNEVQDRLKEPALKLSGGQQQRLCLARILALEPEVILLDEPCSGLDPISTLKIEESLIELKAEMAIVLVTNNVKQAARVSQKTAFLLEGKLVEYNTTAKLFTTPENKHTEDYISGRFG